MGALTTKEQWFNCALITIAVTLAISGYFAYDKSSKMHAARKSKVAESVILGGGEEEVKTRKARKVEEYKAREAEGRSS